MESILVYDYLQYGSFGFPDVYSSECDIIRLPVPLTAIMMKTG